MDDHEYARVLRATITELTRNIAAPTTIDDTLRSVTKACVELIDAVDCADVLLITGRTQFETAAPTAPLAAELDTVQQHVGEGPCLAAAAGDAVIRCPDLRRERRWPRFAAAAVAAGVYSMLSFQLYTTTGRSGALNLHGYRPEAFDPESEAIGAMLATHAATALIAHDRQDQFRSALASRDTIGQAKGMIMERFGVDAVRAFELLTKLSQDSNTPLARVAAELVGRGSDPHR